MNPIYKILAGAVVLLVLVGAILFYRGNSIKAKADLQVAQTELVKEQAINKANAENLLRMEATAKANDALLTAMQADLTIINSKRVDDQKTISNLRTNNVQARDYLSTPVDPAVASVLNR